MKNTLKYTLTAILLAAAPLASADVIDCVKLSNTVKAAVSASPNNVTDIVTMHIAANESCACEIVKAAITASHASKSQVAEIVYHAILEAPSQMRIITQCAIATAPDAVSNINDAVSELIGVFEKFTKVDGKVIDSEKGVLDDSKRIIEQYSTQPDGSNPLDFPTSNGYEEIGPPPIFRFPPIPFDPPVTVTSY